MNAYSVQSKAIHWLFVVLIPCLMIGTGILWTWIVVSRPNQDAGLLCFGALWWGLVMFGVYRQVTMPHTIEFPETGNIRFVGTFRTLTIAPSEIRSIRTYSGPFVQVKHSRGSLLMLHQFTGFHDFVSELKRVNPNVELRGV
jgi:phosphotransferase system  glucose/maltose/N-acetylglucosamine-specific IIC component